MALTNAQKKLRHAKLGNLWRDLVIIVFGVVVTLLLVKMGALGQFLTAAQERAYIGSFIAGIFCTSVFTIAPAAIALAFIAHNGAHPLTIAVWGGMGAMLGDLLLFLFIRDVFSEDVESLSFVRRWKHAITRPHLGFLRWLLPVIGAIIIASPLPDEIGLALLGFSKTKTPVLLPIAFAMNFLGILAIAVVAAQVA